MAKTMTMTKTTAAAPTPKTRCMAPLGMPTDLRSNATTQVTTSLLQNGIDEAERRACFLFDATRDTV